ncbi:MAG: Mu transposase C-terminal domain-containing protein [Limnoraphis sp.]
MAQVRFRRGLNFWLDGKQFCIKKRLNSEEFQILDAITEELSSIKESILLELLVKERIQFEPPDNADKNRNNDWSNADFSEIDPRLKEEATNRLKYVERFLEKDIQSRTPKTLEPIIEEVSQEISDKNPPGWLSLYLWIKRYEEGGYDIRSLVSKTQAKGNRKSRLADEIYQIINEVKDELYLSKTKPTIADAVSEIRYRITQENYRRSQIGTLKPLKIPHESTIYRIYSQIDPYEEAVGRYGKRTADRMYDMSGKEPIRPQRPLQIVEIDHTPLPFYVVDSETRLPIGRPNLVTVIDKYTQIPCGYDLSFDPESGLSVMRCLNHAIRPKNYVSEQYPNVSNTWDTYGLMEMIRVDNAGCYTGTQLEDAAKQLNFNISQTPPKVPWYKGSIERHFKTINTQLLQGQPGSFLKNLKMYDDQYDPYKEAVVSLDALHEMIHIFIIDIVSQASHSDLKTPRSEVWKAAITEFPPAMPTKMQDLRILLGAVTHRVISKNGIEFEGLYYKSPELTRLRTLYEKRDRRRQNGTNNREKAKVKYDPGDISCVYVFDPEGQNYVPIPAVSQDYTQGLSLWQHKAIKKYAAQETEKVDLVALSIAKKKIQKIVEQEWNNSKRHRTRTQMARWNQVGLIDYNIKEVEVFVQQEKEKEDNFSNAKSASFEKMFVQSDAMAGLSNVGSGFKSSPNKNAENTDQKIVEYQITHPNSAQLPDNLVEATIDSEPSEVPNPKIPPSSPPKPQSKSKSKKRSSSKQKGKKSNSEESPVTENNKVVETQEITVKIEEWEPDLSEWSTNYD